MIARVHDVNVSPCRIHGHPDGERAASPRIQRILAHGQITSPLPVGLGLFELRDVVAGWERLVFVPAPRIGHQEIGIIRELVARGRHIVDGPRVANAKVQSDRFVVGIPAQRAGIQLQALAEAIGFIAERTSSQGPADARLNLNPTADPQKQAKVTR